MITLDTTSFPRAHAGFGLVELLVVIMIIAILAAVAIPLYASQRDKAKLADLRENAYSVRTHLISCFVDGLSTTYRAGVTNHASATYTTYARQYASNALEAMLEAGRAHGDNAQGYVNPHSAKRAVLNASSASTSSTYAPPAVFITNGSGYRYASFNSANTWLRGTVMVVWNTSTQMIETYAVGRDGRKVAGTLATCPM